MTDLLDIHTHTVVSGHAYNSLYEMVKAGADKGLALFGSSDHAPSMPGSCHEMYFCNFSCLPRELYGIRLLMGCELNILDYSGKVDLPVNLLKRLHYGIASIHDLCYKVGNREQNTAAVIGAMKNPYIQVIGHPDSSRIPLDYKAIVLAAKEQHVLLEVNNSSLKPGSPRPGARENYKTMLALCQTYAVPIIVNSDAHCAVDAGQHDCAMELIREIQFPEELVVNGDLDHFYDFIPDTAE